jgi:hypothetical protein
LRRTRRATAQLSRDGQGCVMLIIYIIYIIYIILALLVIVSLCWAAGWGEE